MEAPWKGEKVNVVIRCLAIIFVVLAFIAFGGGVITFLETGEITFNKIDFRIVIGMVSAPYCFLLFLKVAVTGYAPKSWVPWK
jgi:hypothetical protein